MGCLGKVETSWNWVLADKKGNIGYQMSGLMPKRRQGISGFVPLPGWEVKNDWQGFVETCDLPCCYNPECGYFVTSNQDLNEYGKVDPINVGMGSYRSDRIAKHLAKNNQMTVKDMAVIHHDFYINFDRILLAEHSLWFGGQSRENFYTQALETALTAPVKKWGDTRKVMMKNIVF